MSPDQAVDEDLILTLPLPLARLARRAHNARAPLERHQHAFYLWEAALKLLASVAVVHYADRRTHDPRLAERLQTLARPSLGHWWEYVKMLVPALANAGDAGFKAVHEVLFRPLPDDVAAITDLDALLRREAREPPAPRGRPRPDQLFDRLVHYRNREIGHGAVGQRPPEYYEDLGRALLRGVPEVLRRLDLLAGGGLVYVVGVHRHEDGGWLVERDLLRGETARTLPPLKLPAAEAARLPLAKCLYLDATAGDRRLRSLRPLLEYVAGDVAFLNSRRGQRRANYLCYATGSEADLEDRTEEQRALLERVLGRPVDHDVAQAWAVEAEAEEDRVVAAAGGTVPPAAEAAPAPPGLCAWVVLSERERTAAYRLRTTVGQALQRLAKETPVAGSEQVYATDAVTSLDALRRTIGGLCRSEVAVFDITDYEPAVMLLLGIRSAVRRGITVLSMGGELGLESIADLPFNIKDANLISHSQRQQQDERRRPWQMLHRRLAAGVRQMHSHDYLDLPAYDAVRNLPEGERGTVPPEEGVLVLASFGKAYVPRNWKGVLLPGLEFEQELLRGERGLEGRPQLGVARSVDLDSPRLVSHAIYSYIRRAALCVADWTEWRPNVFFELGVRLAVGKGRTVNIIEAGYRPAADRIAEDPQAAGEWVRERGLAGPEEPEQLEAVTARIRTIAPQCRRLCQLFACLDYDLRPGDDAVFARVFGRGVEPRPECPAVAAARQAVVEAVAVAAEPAAVPLHRELLRSALRFSSDDTEGMSAVLFPENPELRRVAARALKGRILAAWQHLLDAYSLEEIKRDPLLCEECNTIVSHLTNYRKDPDLQAQEAFWARVREVRKALSTAGKKASR